MNTRSVKFGLFALLIFCMASLTSCKDKDTQPEEIFDIHNPEGYFLFIRDMNGDGSDPFFLLFEFMPGKNIRKHAVSTYIDTQYSFKNDSTILDDAGNQFVFEGNSVTSNNPNIKEIVVIKAPESNQLTGKTFAGTYYKSDISVLHQSFFYSFAPDGEKVNAGFNPGTIERTERYTKIGNIAARAALENGDFEFMILVNGKLEVNYKTATNNQNYWPDFHGTFTQQ
jgi:hypothetical protein